MSVVERLDAALNARDIEAMVALLAPDYDSVQPAHPDRAFTGRDQVHKNWSAMFAGVPDFRSELVRTCADGDTVWSEWRWQGTDLDIAGVIVMGIRDEEIAWARLYVEPIEQAGAGIEAAVRRLTGDS
jgi:ketosteroid isomerase-like protein